MYKIPSTTDELEVAHKELRKTVNKQIKILKKSAPRRAANWNWLIKYKGKPVKIIWSTIPITLIYIILIPLFSIIFGFKAFVSAPVERCLGFFFRAYKVAFWSLLVESLAWSFPIFDGGYFRYRLIGGSTGPAAFYWNKPKSNYELCSRDLLDGYYPFWTDNEKKKEVNKYLENGERKAKRSKKKFYVNWNYVLAN